MWGSGTIRLRNEEKIKNGDNSHKPAREKKRKKRKTIVVQALFFSLEKNKNKSEKTEKVAFLTPLVLFFSRLPMRLDTMVLNFLWEPLNSGKSTVEREREREK